MEGDSADGSGGSDLLLDDGYLGAIKDYIARVEVVHHFAITLSGMMSRRVKGLLLC
ncbi:conserved hypothetical protein [Ricinus communis]|uniref:Uncharacterized protein n=1 Tax=Ricinus communis TaxID=3988 RepID=B9T0K8_RICCO|nr:conserved hypothetical protein [Ricinus communis]